MNIKDTLRMNLKSNGVIGLSLAASEMIGTPVPISVTPVLGNIIIVVGGNTAQKVSQTVLPDNICDDVILETTYTYCKKFVADVDLCGSCKVDLNVIIPAQYRETIKFCPVCGGEL